MSDHHSNNLSGLRNLGNTCYLNSAVQMLFSLQNGFVEELMSRPTSGKLHSALKEVGTALRKEDGNVVDPTPVKQAVDELTDRFIGYRQQDSHEFLMALLDLLHDEMEGDNKKDKKQEGIEEEKKDDAIPQEEIAKPIESSPPLERMTSFSNLDSDAISDLLHGEEARDAPSWSSVKHETQMTLVGGRATTPAISAISLMEGVLPQKRNADLMVLHEAQSDDEQVDHMEPDEVTVAESLNQNTHDESGINPVNKYFTSEVQVTLTCDSCSYTRSKVELYRHISIEVANTSNTVLHGLAKFFQPEKRELKCEKCFCETATQHMQFVQLPRCLLIHFKRFIVEMSPDYYVTFRKNQAEVEFEEEINLEDYCNENREYGGFRLRSSVHHIGSTASCGHYTADAMVENTNETWMRFNDSCVSSVSKEEALGFNAQKKAYMVMYEFLSEV